MFDLFIANSVHYFRIYLASACAAT